MKLICQKGVYTYEWVDGDDKFKYEGLPPRKEFCSQLQINGIHRKEYTHAKLVYRTFNCKTFQDYHDIYLKTDVLLLAAIFENFRKASIANFKLDPANVMSAASFAWSAML